MPILVAGRKGRRTKNQAQAISPPNRIAMGPPFSSGGISLHSAAVLILFGYLIFVLFSIVLNHSCTKLFALLLNPKEGRSSPSRILKQHFAPWIRFCCESVSRDFPSRLHEPRNNKQETRSADPISLFTVFLLSCPVP